MDQLIACLDARCVERDHSFIVIEGFMESGKSTLAERLECRLGWVHVELDEFLNKQPVPELSDKRYVANIRDVNLQQKLSELVKESRRMILEGVCIQPVLKRIGLTEYVTIYVKKLTAGGRWDQGRDLSEFHSVQEVIAQKDYLDPLDVEVLEYHFKFQPHKSSAIVFCWTDI